MCGKEAMRRKEKQKGKRSIEQGKMFQSMEINLDKWTYCTGRRKDEKRFSVCQVESQGKSGTGWGSLEKKRECVCVCVCKVGWLLCSGF